MVKLPANGGGCNGVSRNRSMISSGGFVCMYLNGILFTGTPLSKIRLTPLGLPVKSRKALYIPGLIPI